MITLGRIDADGNLMRSSVLYDVTVVADTRSNTLLVTAPPETMPLIETIIQQLDQLPSAESKIKVFELVNGDAYSLTTMLTNLFAASTTGGGFGGGTTGTSQIATVRPGIEEGESTLVSVRFQTDVRTNSIIACGSEGDMAVVEALLLRLDAENKNNRKVMLLKLVNTPAEQIAPILQTYVTNERQIDIQNSTTLLPESPLEQYRKELNVVAEPISNSLIISTTPRYYNQIKKIVQELDERPLMVAIQVLIAEVKMNSNKERGIEVGLQDSLLFDRSIGVPNAPGFLFGSNNALPTGIVNAGTVATQGISSLGVGRSGSGGIGGFSFSASSESVSVLVRALETQDKLRVLSRPQLVTLHNKRAAILVGQSVPYVTGSSTTNNTTQSETAWQPVGTILDVTPRIMPDGMIAMAVYIERSSMGSEADGVPLYTSNNEVIRQAKINNTNAQTTINAMDGQTVVFAGLITEQKETVNRSIPGLNKIPVVKHFFEYDSQVCQRSELLIVMTPTIIRNREDMELLKQQETSRMHWCINDVVKLTGNSSMRLRSDAWLPDEIEYRNAAPMILNENQLPPENKIPVPVLAPMIE
jgi:type II secretion system protein D